MSLAVGRYILTDPKTKAGSEVLHYGDRVQDLFDHVLSTTSPRNMRMRTLRSDEPPSLPTRT
jgi:hypothetical protein